MLGYIGRDQRPCPCVSPPLCMSFESRSASSVILVPCMSLTARAPPKWKVSLVLLLGVSFINYPLANLVILPRYSATLGMLPCVMLLAAVTLPCAIFVIIPVLLRVFGQWVYAPWQESRWVPMRVLQIGLPWPF
jgi:hypothetical protein